MGRQGLIRFNQVQMNLIKFSHRIKIESYWNALLVIFGFKVLIILK